MNCQVGELLLLFSEKKTSWGKPTDVELFGPVAGVVEKNRFPPKGIFALEGDVDLEHNWKN